MTGPLDGAAERMINETQAWLSTFQSLGGVVSAVFGESGDVEDYTLLHPDKARLTPKGRYKLLCLQRALPEPYWMKATLKFEAVVMPTEGGLQ